MECRTLNKSRIAKNSRDGKSNAINKQTDDFHTTFPNFMILTEEERREFFQTLYSAKLKLEQNGVTVLPQFGTIHDQSSWNDSKSLETIEEKSTDYVNSSEEEISNSEDNVQEGYKSRSGKDVFSWNRIMREECVRDNAHMGCLPQYPESVPQMNDFAQNSPRCCPTGSHEKVNKVKALLEAYKNENPKIPENKFMAPQCRFFNVNCCNEKMSADQLDKPRRDDVLKIKGKNLKVQVTVSSVENERMKKAKSAKGMYRSEMNDHFLSCKRGYVGYSARRSGTVCFKDEELETFSEPLEYPNKPPFEGDICDSGIRSFACVKMENKETMVNAPDKCLLRNLSVDYNDNCCKIEMACKSTQTDSTELETCQTTQVEKIDKGVGSGEVLLEPEVQETPETEAETESEKPEEKLEEKVEEAEAPVTGEEEEEEAKKPPEKNLPDYEDEPTKKRLSEDIDDPELKDLLNVELDEGDMDTDTKKKKRKRFKSPTSKRSTKSVGKTSADMGETDKKGKGIGKSKSGRMSKKKAETETKIANPFVVAGERKSDNPFLTDEKEECEKILGHTDSRVLARKNLTEQNQSCRKRLNSCEERMLEPKYSPAFIDQKMLGDIQKEDICRKPECNKIITPRRTEIPENYNCDEETTKRRCILSVDNKLLSCGKRSVGVQVEKKQSCSGVEDSPKKMIDGECCLEFQNMDEEEVEEVEEPRSCCTRGEIRVLGKPEMVDACVGDEFDIKGCEEIEDDKCEVEEQQKEEVGQTCDDLRTQEYNECGGGRRRTTPQGPPPSGKVVFVDDNVIDKIRDVITDLERKTKSGEKCQLENEYVGLLLEHLDYLTTILTNVSDNQRAIPDEPKMEDDIDIKDTKDEEAEKPEESPKVPPSTSEEESEQELESQYSQSTEEKKDPEKEEGEAGGGEEEEEEEKEEEGRRGKKKKKKKSKERFRWLKRLFRRRRSRKNIRFRK